MVAPTGSFPVGFISPIDGPPLGDGVDAATGPESSSSEMWGLREIYGRASGGGLASWEYVGQRLANDYINNPVEQIRQSIARKRDELYKGAGQQYLEELIQAAFEDVKNKNLRTKLIEWSRWNNVIKRIVHEKATVYAAPATRRVADSAGNVAYQKFQKLVRMNAVMKQLNRMLVLHEDVWVQYRVRWTPRGRQPVIDVISPASFWAIHHPRDKTLLIGIILDQRPNNLLPNDATEPCYRVWTDKETFQLDAGCRVIETSIERWTLNRMPGVLASTVPPSTKNPACLLEHAPSADLVAGHQAVWFLNLTVLKESKSKSNQNYWSGDTSSAVMGQQNDTESDVVVPEGVTVQSLDRGLEIKPISETSTQVLDDTAANHGLPPSVMHHRDAASGSEIELRRIPLRELRLEQIEVMRDTERELAEIESEVNAMTDANGGVELGDALFTLDGWGVDFGEVQEPQSSAEKDTTFENRRRLGLTDTIEELMDRNPDLDVAGAETEQELHVTRETARVAQQKTLMALNGSTSSAPGDPTPADNGQAGQAAPGKSKP